MIFLKPEEYLPKLNEIYIVLSERLRLILPYADVDHIGSSAIHGAISKGDLDILVRVPKEQFGQALLEIKDLGFSEKEGSLRTDSLCNLETKNYETDVAVQLIEKGSEFEDFIVFRDRLNSDSSLVEEYNKLKMTCAGLSSDEYRKKKSVFIETVLPSKN